MGFSRPIAPWCLPLLFVSVSLADEKADPAPPQPPALNVGDLAPCSRASTSSAAPGDPASMCSGRSSCCTSTRATSPANWHPPGRSFRDNLEALPAKGIKVVGVSGDVPATHQLFKEAHKLNYTLLADPEGAVAKRFGVPVSAGGKVRARTADGEPLWDADGKTLIVSRPVTLARWTLILDRDGKVAYKNTKADPVPSSQEVLRFVEDTGEEGQVSAAESDMRRSRAEVDGEALERFRTYLHLLARAIWVSGNAAGSRLPTWCSRRC